MNSAKGWMEGDGMGSARGSAPRPTSIIALKKHQQPAVGL
ncbi:hypothetical protein BN2497_8939 [Janthinobacterium sp. CG23_2]|nr:hypothetical protein BN2497_8939 [Janthinobacterium sp. CG23_2]CUU30867.1 hypothetical protein BN3177_8939 [Janthinobacterium sp. CG23_2]